MKKKINFVKTTLVLGVTVMALGSANVMAEKYFTIKDGKLERPTGYREWVYIDTPITPDSLNKDTPVHFPEFHHVYMDPDSWAYWKEKGELRDGTVFIKERTSVGSTSAPSGNGFFAGHFIGLEASIKSKKYFPKEPGNWAYFTFGAPDNKTILKEVKASPTESCNACHASAAAADFVFSQYYPVLRFAKGKGKSATGGYQDIFEPIP